MIMQSVTYAPLFPHSLHSSKSPEEYEVERLWDTLFQYFPECKCFCFMERQKQKGIMVLIKSLNMCVQLYFSIPIFFQFYHVFKRQKRTTGLQRRQMSLTHSQIFTPQDEPILKFLHPKMNHFHLSTHHHLFKYHIYILIS